MRTQYEKNSIYLAGAVMRARQRERKLKGEIALFLTCTGGVCALLYIIISSIPY